MRDRIRAEDLIGRETELSGVLRIAEAVPDGLAETRLVLLSGDAGVGKTRLLTEALERLTAQGWKPLVGHCLDFGETSMPYLPFAEMLGQQLTSSTGDDAVGRTEVFESVLTALEDAAISQPVVVVIEDAHWADASTCDLISFLLARRLRGRILLAVSYRSDEMHRRHPLRQRVAEWVRLPGVERIQLEPLQAGDVRGLVGQLIGSFEESYDDDIERIVQRAQGNAFYVEELVGAFLGGGWSLPDDLADLLLVRLERLDESTRALVRVASVSGQRIPHDLLARVSPSTEDELDAGLRAAIDANVLIRTGDSEYAFRHALLGEAVYDDLLPGERMRLHTAYAEAVRELRDSRGAADLARHALASHDLPTALLASVDAGEQALATGGPDEAARHLMKALEIYDRASGSLDEPPAIAELVARTVEALCGAGRPETGLSLVEQQLAALPSDGPPADRARLLLAQAEALSDTEFEGKPATLTAEALELVGDEPTRLRARILGTHAHMLVWQDDFDEARAVADEALELADELGLSRLSADVGLTLTVLSQHLNPGEATRVELKRIIAEAQARGDIASQLRGHMRRGIVESDAGSLAEAQEAFLTAARLARQSGRPWTLHGVGGRLQGGVVAHMRGLWDEALAIADSTGEDPPPTARAMLDSVNLLVAAGRGDTSLIERLPAIRERWHRDGLVAIVGGGAAIELLAQRDGADAAVQKYDDICQVLTPLWGPDFGGRLRLATQALAALADEAPRTPTGARDDVRATAARLVEDGQRVLKLRENEGRPFQIEGRAWEARLGAEQLRLEWLLGSDVDLATLTDRWRTTAELFGELGHALEEARARTRLALVLRASGDTAGSQVQAEAAHAVATRLGAKPLLAELGAVARPSEAGVLTPREQEILGLVAAGRSNAAIAQQLFISAKTVSVHVSNVMGKLGAGSRTEAVALARQSGLID